MKKRKKEKRVSGVPVDAKLVAEDPTRQNSQIFIGKDGAVYIVRLEKVTYRVLGGVQ